MYQLDPAVKGVWSISYVMRTIFLTIVVFIIDILFIQKNIDFWFFPSGTLSLIIFFVGLILSFIIPPISYKYWKFDVRESEVYLERGILTRIKTTAPFSRIQHLDVQQSLMERMFKLSKLVLYTAGTRGADVIIPGLPIEYAEELRDHLKDITAEDSL